jgi:molybdate transport system substrate-binding protein
MALAAILAATTLSGCGSSAVNSTEATSVKVFIAASLSNAMNDIAADFNKDNPNVDIIFNADSSGTLQTQIEEGAECDIFFSAAEKQMNALDSEGYIESDSITPLLENKVVLIKPSGSDTAVTGFENITDAASLALAGEDVPVGSYAREIFNNLGITDAVMSMEINEGANVTAVLTAVAEGANEVGVVYSTDAASIDGVEVIAEAPEGSLDTPVIYPVAAVKNNNADDNETSAANEFLEYLKSDAAAAVFESYGFTIEK